MGSPSEGGTEMRRYALKTVLLVAFWALMLAAGQMFDQGAHLVGMGLVVAALAAMVVYVE